MASTTVSHVPATDADRKKKKRAAVIKLSLAGAAILGIGAAATSAAWTDDAWFNASASSATVELQGSLDGTNWSEADATPGLNIPTGAFGNLLPNQAPQVTVHLKNAGSTTLAVASTVTLSGVVFDGAPNNAKVTVAPVANIPAGSTADVVVTLTTPANWADTFQGTTGAVTIRFTGSTL
ncbi:hypothetical protein [Cellulomonas sp. P5_E12]